MERINLNEGSYAFVLAQTALLNCRVAGMQAENQYRISIGQSPTYYDLDFKEVEREFSQYLCWNAIIEITRE